MGYFSEDFLLGAATAAHQVEGNNIHSDYWAQEQLPHTSFVEPSGITCDHYNRYKEDIKLMAEAGLNAYRFSIEWARIEPEEGVFDESEVEHYRDVIRCCKENGIELFVVQIPVGRYRGDDWPTFTDDMLKMANTFYDYLSQKGIPHKFYQKTKELGIDWEKDYADSTHLNAYGALKASENLGAYLKELYDLPDHRSEEKYRQWNIDAEHFYSLLEEAEKEREE